MKNILLTFTLFTLLVPIGIMFIYYSESSKRTFQDYDELLASGIIDKGWVPTYIPKSATDINEQHNIDTNEVNINFKFVMEDNDTLNKKCTLLVDNKKGKKYVCPPFVGETSVLILRNDGIGYYNSTSDGLNY